MSITTNSKLDEKILINEELKFITNEGLESDIYKINILAILFIHQAMFRFIRK